MGLFNLFKKKVNMVVKKRTTDNKEFKIVNMDSKVEKSTHIASEFKSPVYGSDEKKDVFVPRVSDIPVDAYDFLRKEPIKNTGKDSDNPFPEFRKVEPRHKKEEKTNTVVVEEKETITEFFGDKTEEKKVEEPVKTEETKAQVFKYEENDEPNPSFDPTVFSSLFGVDVDKPKKVKEEPKENKAEDTSSFSESIFSEPVQEEKPAFESREESNDPEKEAKAHRDKMERIYKNYKLPPLSLLPEPVFKIDNDDEWNVNNIAIINQTLQSFRIDGQVKEYTQGPTFTRYAIMLGPGVPGSKISNIQDDLQRTLATSSLRIENPIPGKPYVGIEILNLNRRSVTLRELIGTEEFMNSKDPLLVPVGLDVEGKVKYSSVADFPHGLIAGSSGSGKSVYLSCFIASLLYKNTPETLRFFFIDPKQVDLSQFDGIPHLLSPIVTDPKEGVNSIKWLIDEMERRNTIFRSIPGITKLSEYNKYADSHKGEYKKIPYIVAVIDEAADFLLNAGNEAQDLLTKLLQKSRAAGIHVILAMQKPVAAVVSTTIKSNAGCRFAFKVTDRVDSMTIIGKTGAESLLGRGDMIYYLNGDTGRYQSGFISGADCVKVKEHCQSQAPLDYLFLPSELDKKNNSGQSAEIDELFGDIARYVVYEGRCSINAISQKFNVGYNRANAIVLSMEYFGIVSETQGTKARQILITPEEIESKLQSIGVR